MLQLTSTVSVVSFSLGGIGEMGSFLLLVEGELLSEIISWEEEGEIPPSEDKKK